MNFIENITDYSFNLPYTIAITLAAYVAISVCHYIWKA